MFYIDTFTHALIPFLSGKASKKDKEACAALLLGGLAPDFDISFLFLRLLFPALYFSIPASFLPFHRGITHTIIFGTLTAWLFLFGFSRKPVSRALKNIFKSDISLLFNPKLMFFSAIGMLSHLFLDVLTTYGIPLFYPFSTKRYAIELFFYIDIYLSMIGAVLTGYALYRKGWFRTPFGAINSKEIGAVYKKLLFVVVASIVLLAGARYYEKSASAEYFGADMNAVYPTPAITVWTIAKPNADNTYTIYTFDALRNAIVQKSETSPTSFKREFPPHGFLVNSGN